MFPRVREIQSFLEKPLVRDAFRKYVQKAEIKRPLAALQGLKGFRRYFSGIAMDIMAII